MVTFCAWVVWMIVIGRAAAIEKAADLRDQGTLSPSECGALKATALAARR